MKVYRRFKNKYKEVYTHPFSFLDISKIFFLKKVCTEHDYIIYYKHNILRVKKNTTISYGTIMEGFVAIGSDCFIGEKTKLSVGVILKNHVYIGKGTTIEGGTFYSWNIIPEESNIEDTFMYSYCDFDYSNSIYLLTAYYGYDGKAFIIEIYKDNIVRKKFYRNSFNDTEITQLLHTHGDQIGGYKN